MNFFHIDKSWTRWDRITVVGIFVCVALIAGAALIRAM
jgi:hypothetical protein